MSGDRVRLDRWLWAARFFKTRAMARDAIEGGKVRVNGERPKPGKLVGPGDEVRLRKGGVEFLVTVRALSEQRGPATVARTLYEEDPLSVAARQRRLAQARARPTPIYEGKGRPTKRDRRRLDAWRPERAAD